MGYAPSSSPRSLIRELSDRGSLVGPDAVRYLQEQADLRSVAASLRRLAELPMVLTVGHLRRMEARGRSADGDDADGATRAAVPADAGLAVPERSTATPPPSASTAGLAGRSRRSDPSTGRPQGPSPPAGTGRSGGTAGTAGTAVGQGPRTLAGDDGRGPADGPATGPTDGPGDGPGQDQNGHAAPPLRVVRDITGESTCAGELSDFTRYFNARYEELKALLRRRPELTGAVPVKALDGRDEVKVIGMVTGVRSTKNGHRLIELEDDTGQCAVLASAQDPEALAKTKDLLEDEVVGVVGKMARKGDLVILRDLVRPDVPHLHETAWADEPCGVLFVSDTHIGSRTFMEDAWERLIAWLDGTAGSEEQRALAERVRYVVACGDIVEGIGIYPGQRHELEITDIYDQYAEAARLFDGIPDRVETFVMPGNHDAVRPAEPQPTFPEAIRDLFPDRFTFVGNPCTFEIGGVSILAYHGRSFDDYITQVQGLEYGDPLPIMVEMLRRRHLCPMYGGKTPVAPEARDHLIVPEVPDVFVTGHGHACAMGRYRGITLVNASTWQSQTPFQRMMRYTPDPAKACFVDVGTGEQRILSFT